MLRPPRQNVSAFQNCERILSCVLGLQEVLLSAEPTQDLSIGEHANQVAPDALVTVIHMQVLS